MKHKGDFYCYDATTTSKKQVLHAEEDGLTYLNPILSNLAKDDFKLAQTVCDGMVEKGLVPMDCFCAVVKGTLTLEFK